LSADKGISILTLPICVHLPGYLRAKVFSPLPPRYRKKSCIFAKIFTAKNAKNSKRRTYDVSSLRPLRSLWINSFLVAAGRAGPLAPFRGKLTKMTFHESLTHYHRPSPIVANCAKSSQIGLFFMFPASQFNGVNEGQSGPIKANQSKKIEKVANNWSRCPSIRLAAFGKSSMLHDGNCSGRFR
jgi:hypothetical protein